MRPHLSTLARTYDATTHASCTPSSRSPQSAHYSTKNALEELLGATGAGGRVSGVVSRGVETARAQELVEEEPTQGLGRARVAREQRALHDLGEIDEREHRAVQVGEVRGEGGLLLAGELFGHPGRWYQRTRRPGVSRGAVATMMRGLRDRDRVAG